jgi:lipopolysaccharide transport system permease protein
MKRQENRAADVAEPQAESLAVRHVHARKGLQGLELRELWSRRELLWFLALRDIRVRYKQTFLGAGWAVLQPFIQMVVFSLFFGGLLNVSSEGLPYPVFSFSALVPWTLFTMIVGGSASSLTGNAGILTKVYFPRLLIPLSNIVARLADFAVAFVILLLMIVVFGIPLTVNILLFPVFLLLLLVCGLGVGLCLGAVNVHYRDVQVLVPFFLQIWMYASPVVYSTKVLTNPIVKFIYGLNPMVAVLQGFRWCLLPTAAAPGPEIWLSAVIAVVFLATGLMLFQRVQRNMADIV